MTNAGNGEDYPLEPLDLELWEARRALEREHLEGTVDAEAAPRAVGFPSGEGEATVWLAQAAEDLRRGHPLIVLCRGGAAVAYELAGMAPERPVQRLLAAAGLTDAPPLGAAARALDPREHPLLPIMGFALFAPEAVEAVARALDKAFRGDLGGFSAVTLGQLGFHHAPPAFSAAWIAAGRPPIRVRHPQWVEPGASGGQPAPLHEVLGGNVGHRRSLLPWEGATMDDDGGDDDRA